MADEDTDDNAARAERGSVDTFSPTEVKTWAAFGSGVYNFFSNAWNTARDYATGRRGSGDNGSSGRGSDDDGLTEKSGTGRVARDRRPGKTNKDETAEERKERGEKERVAALKEAEAPSVKILQIHPDLPKHDDYSHEDRLAGKYEQDLEARIQQIKSDIAEIHKKPDGKAIAILPDFEDPEAQTKKYLDLGFDAVTFEAPATADLSADNLEAVLRSQYETAKAKGIAEDKIILSFDSTPGNLEKLAAILGKKSNAQPAPPAAGGTTANANNEPLSAEAEKLHQQWQIEKKALEEYEDYELQTRSIRVEQASKGQGRYPSAEEEAARIKKSNEQHAALEKTWNEYVARREQDKTSPPATQPPPVTQETATATASAPAPDTKTVAVEGNEKLLAALQRGGITTSGMIGKDPKIIAALDKLLTEHKIPVTTYETTPTAAPAPAAGNVASTGQYWGTLENITEATLLAKINDPAIKVIEYDPEKFIEAFAGHVATIDKLSPEKKAEAKQRMIEINNKAHASGKKVFAYDVFDGGNGWRGERAGMISDSGHNFVIQATADLSKGYHALAFDGMAGDNPSRIAQMRQGDLSTYEEMLKQKLKSAKEAGIPVDHIALHTKNAAKATYETLSKKENADLLAAAIRGAVVIEQGQFDDNPKYIDKLKALGITNIVDIEFSKSKSNGYAANAEGTKTFAEKHGIQSVLMEREEPLERKGEPSLGGYDMSLASTQVFGAKNEGQPAAAETSKSELQTAREYLYTTVNYQGTIKKQDVAAIDSLHPVLTGILAKVMKQARDQGLPVTIESAFRTADSGVSFFKDHPELSQHSHGVAVDINNADGRFHTIAKKAGLYDFGGGEEMHFQIVSSIKATERQLAAFRAFSTDSGPTNIVKIWEASGVPVPAGYDFDPKTGAIKSYKGVTAAPVVSLAERFKNGIASTYNQVASAVKSTVTRMFGHGAEPQIPADGTRLMYIAGREGKKLLLVNNKDDSVIKSFTSHSGNGSGYDRPGPLRNVDAMPEGVYPFLWDKVYDMHNSQAFHTEHTEGGNRDGGMWVHDAAIRLRNSDQAGASLGCITVAEWEEFKQFVAQYRPTTIQSAVAWQPRTPEMIAANQNAPTAPAAANDNAARELAKAHPANLKNGTPGLAVVVNGPQGPKNFYFERPDPATAPAPAQPSILSNAWNSLKSLVSDISAKVGFGHRFGDFQNGVKGLIIHHAGGRTPSGIIDTFHRRTYPAQFILTRGDPAKGIPPQVLRTLPEGAQGQHMKQGGYRKADGTGRGYGNWNMEGIEVAALDNSDWAPGQREVLAKFVFEHAAKNGYDLMKTMWGHGEVNGHKERNEGMYFVSWFRENYTALKEQYLKDKAAEAAAVTTATPPAPAQATAAATLPTELSSNVEERRLQVAEAAVAAFPDNPAKQEFMVARMSLETGPNFDSEIFLKAKNGFGIKALDGSKQGPAGRGKYLTHEYTNSGARYAVEDWFRKYNTVAESMKEGNDYFYEPAKKQYYGGVVAALDKNASFAELAKALGDSPYATAPKPQYETFLHTRRKQMLPYLEKARAKVAELAARTKADTTVADLKIPTPPPMGADRPMSLRTFLPSAEERARLRTEEAEAAAERAKPTAVASATATPTPSPPPAPTLAPGGNGETAAATPKTDVASAQQTPAAAAPAPPATATTNHAALAAAAKGAERGQSENLIPTINAQPVPQSPNVLYRYVLILHDSLGKKTIAILGLPPEEQAKNIADYMAGLTNAQQLPWEGTTYQKAYDIRKHLIATGTVPPAAGQDKVSSLKDWNGKLASLDFDPKPTPITAALASTAATTAQTPPPESGPVSPSSPGPTSGAASLKKELSEKAAADGANKLADAPKPGGKKDKELADAKQATPQEPAVA